MPAACFATCPAAAKTVSAATAAIAQQQRAPIISLQACLLAFIACRSTSNNRLLRHRLLVKLPTTNTTISSTAARRSTFPSTAPSWSTCARAAQLPRNFPPQAPTPRPARAPCWVPSESHFRGTGCGSAGCAARAGGVQMGAALEGSTEQRL